MEVHEESMEEQKSAYVLPKTLVVLTPLIRTPERNVIRISRSEGIENDKFLHIAAGEHLGIVVNRFNPEKPPKLGFDADVTLNFSVWLSDGASKRQENRQLRFWFDRSVSNEEKHSMANLFFKDLVNSLPEEYVPFVKRALKLMQVKYEPVREIEIDMHYAGATDTFKMPDLKEYDSDSECENVNVGHVQDVLEHAYPNGLSVAVIAEALRCTEQEVENFLDELLKMGVVRKEQNEWIRTDSIPAQKAGAAGGSMLKEHPPTVAIITCLFVEKQSVDAIIEDSVTVHRYRSGGDSNIYTLGWIGKHRVVATKLAAIGDSREATTSAGSITTRLLGNFQDVDHVFIVGVGGGVAHFTDANRHVRLGDVVVSSSSPDAYVFAHSFTLDRETENVDSFVVRRWNPEDNIIATIAASMDKAMVTEWQSLAEATIEKLGESTADVNFSRPPADNDLFAYPVGGGSLVVIPHLNPERHHPVVHVGPIGALVTYRKHPAGTDEQEDQSRDSASQLRHRFAMDYGLRAVDAGFDSVIAAVQGSRIRSWTLIRGIADYQHGQSRVGRSWQAYAGVQAAALAKSLILRLPVSEQEADQ